MLANLAIDVLMSVPDRQEINLRAMTKQMTKQTSNICRVTAHSARLTALSARQQPDSEAQILKQYIR